MNTEQNISAERRKHHIILPFVKLFLLLLLAAFWAYYCTDNTWLVKQSSPYATFEITTDDNGEFVKTFNNVYFGKNCTYAKFSSITFEEKN